MPSTAISDIDYDARDELLTVTFVTGRVYEYEHVPADVAAAFTGAVSKGFYFNRHIRDQYACRELAPEPPPAPAGPGATIVPFRRR